MLELPQLLLAELETGGVVVTPSRQRAVALRLAYAGAMLGRGEPLWHTPEVIAYAPWLEREALRRAEMDDARALRGAEEWLVWRAAVAEVMRDAETLPTDSLVESIQRSARLLYEWRIPIAALETLGDAESQLLAHAMAGVEARCVELKAVPSHRLTERLHALMPKRAITFAGFTEHSAARAAIVNRWSERGARVREYRGDGALGSLRVTSARDASEELTAAAAWCREQLAQNPARRLLVVVPDLDQRRYAVTQAFEQALASHVTMGQAAPSVDAAEFAIEGGTPLASYPLVRQALAGLRFLCGSLDFAHWSEWFRSSFWSAPSVLDRSRLEAQLRGLLDIELGVKDFLGVLQAGPSYFAAISDQVRATLLRAAQVIEADSTGARAWDWSRKFGAALKALGWPGARALSSPEQQTLARFQEVLAEFAATGSSLGSLRAIDALKVLEDLAGRTAFEPATGDPAVTITASLTDPVVRYDGIWIAGLHADTWPRPVSIDPFIPLSLQRQAGMAAVSPARLLDQARDLLKVWQRSAAEFVVSWPRQDGDREYIASPLLQELESAPPARVLRAESPPRSAPQQFGLFEDSVPRDSESRPHSHSSDPGSSERADGNRTTSPHSLTLAELIRASRSVESYEDAMGEPWLISKPVPAGVRTLEYQNRCAVLAYAEFRLGATRLETPTPGVDFRDRGMLLHSALELLWKRLGGSRELLEAWGPKLDTMIDESIRQAMADAFAVGGVYQEQRSMLREHRRTARLIRNLCELELQRTPFRVSELEGERRWTSQAGSSLRLRIDRVDQLDDGTYAIFDYKSGAAQMQDWIGDRITHPQLLVYMMAAGVDVSAMATVQLTPARVGFKGIADRKGRLPRVSALEGPESSIAQRWQEQTLRWRGAIEQLAADFVAGTATLNPMENACRICHLHAFCRIADVARDPIDRDE